MAAPFWLASPAARRGMVSPAGRSGIAGPALKSQSFPD